jgi:hypothetical protein
MQLDKVVEYHKALADPTRIRMLILLADGEASGQLLAQELSVTPATITHHATKLRQAGLINERRDKNTIYFTLNDYMLRSNAAAAVELITRNQPTAEGDIAMPEQANDKFRASTLRNFFTADGKLKHLPSQLKKKLIVLEHMVSRLTKGQKYTEKEINAFIQGYHADYATIRREFIMHQFMYRSAEVYELNPRVMWAKWEELS